MLLHNVTATLVTPSNFLYELVFERIRFLVAESVEKSGEDIQAQRLYSNS
jgi:hypothetical protein